MKRLGILITGAALMAMSAHAAVGINPCDPGLPQGWTSTAYGVAIGNTGTPTDCSGSNPARLSVIDSWSSAFCVECHTRNPSALIANTTPEGTPPAGSVGSHFVADAVGSTNTGGGFTGATLWDETHTAVTQPRNGGEYEKVSLWAPGTGQATKGLSKYGSEASRANNDIIAGATTTTAGDVICESCHNVLVNEGNQLTLGAYSNAGAAVNGKTGDAICVRCHSTGEGVETYAGFHDNGNLPNFNQYTGKRHHVLTGDTLDLTLYNPDTLTTTNDSRMWAPSYTRELSGGYVATGAAFAFNKGVSATGQGALTTAATTGDIATGTALMCVSCHRPHNAMTKAGAFILRTGNGTDFTSTNTNGIARQTDFSTDYTTSKIYGEYQALCNGCHQGYGL